MTKKTDNCGGLRTKAMHFVKTKSKEWTILFNRLQTNMHIIGQYDNYYTMLQTANEALKELSKTLRYWDKFDCKNNDQMRTVKDQMDDVQTWLKAAEMNINNPIKE